MAMTRRWFSARLMRGAVVVTILSALLAPAMASPAAASFCSQPTCGEVRNVVSAFSVKIANCWPDMFSGTKEGTTLSCMINGWRKDRYDAGWWVNYQQSSYDLGLYYYDTDAFRVDAGCVLIGYNNFGDGLQWDRRGRTHLWVRVTNAEHVTVTQYQCF